MNQVQQMIEQQMLRAAQQVEDQIDSELHRMENMDGDDLERLRQKRVEELKRCDAACGGAATSCSRPAAATTAAAATADRQCRLHPGCLCPCAAPCVPPACRLQQKRQEWARRGHGEYNEVEEKEFFKVPIPALYRPTAD